MRSNSIRITINLKLDDVGYKVILKMKATVITRKY